MAEYVVMPKEDYEAACNSIRGKTGKTDLIKSGNLSAEIDSIETGGGGGEKPFDCRSVTFVYGDKSYVRSVADGDTCADPVSRGLISAPTKESTAQYNYTFYGWGASDGGAADANILKNITSDKTVYAIFTATVRYYTITYYDSDGTTVLNTESLAYGTMPSYAPKKDGYMFSGFDREITVVTGDASYIAQFIEGVDFATSTWASIAKVCEDGLAEQCFSLGDTRTINIGGKNIEFMIVGFNHDDLADGSGKAGISVLAKDTTSTSTVWVSAYSTVPIYSGSKIPSALSTLYDSLDSELKNVIKTVNKKIGGKTKVTVDNATITDYACKLWIPSIQEYNKTRSQYDYYRTKHANVDSLGTAYAGVVHTLKPTSTGMNGWFWYRNLYYRDASVTQPYYWNGSQNRGEGGEGAEHCLLVGFCI